MFTYRYPRAALTVDAIVVAGHKNYCQILLIQRGNEPFKGRWALPGGFIGMEETLEQACIRELYEETGLKVGAMSQYCAFDAIGRDPRHRTISVVFYVFMEKIAEVKGMDDAALARWFPLTNIPPLAFDHSEIITRFFREKGEREFKV